MKSHTSTTFVSGTLKESSIDTAIICYQKSNSTFTALSRHCGSADFHVIMSMGDKPMDFVFYQPNPLNRNTGDCVVRAICKATGKDWYTVYTELCIQGYSMADWGDSNAVWGAYLLENGFRREIVPDTCPACYTIADFCSDHKHGVYIVATGKHVACVIDSTLYDSWRSENEVVTYYFYK